MEPSFVGKDSCRAPSVFAAKILDDKLCPGALCRCALVHEVTNTRFASAADFGFGQVTFGANRAFERGRAESLCATDLARLADCRPRRNLPYADIRFRRSLSTVLACNGGR